MDKWKMFKNYMHNELGITKEDVRMWIEEAVKEQARALIAQEHKAFDVTNIVKGIVTEKKAFGDPHLIQDIKSEVAKQLFNHLTLSLKENK